MAALAEISERLAEDLAEHWAAIPPRTRRLLRKKAKLVAHYTAKLDRIPAWKRK